ncbi:facilitated trehalose transporter Tret1-like [Cydia fagiglandana]|uniref:facilitated trehalose transporter Tret1-like n=1 Tax=Cydia fagiglandana TaxID=1458189 RepID=UPI002FEDEA94
MEFKMKPQPEERKGHTYVQWIVAIIANSSLLTYGLQAGWISPMTKVLQSNSSPAGPLSDYTMSIVASLMPISALIGVPIYAYVADKYGRKTGIMFVTVPHAISWLLKLCCPTPITLIIARVCSGIAAGGCFNVIPMYTKEISQDNIRGLLGSLLIYFHNLGIFLMYVLGAYLDYYTVLYIVVGGPFLSCLLIMMCPESPGFLVKIGKFDEAVKVISSLRGLNLNDSSVQKELDLMRKEEEYYKTLPSMSMMVIMKNRAWRKGYIIATLMVLAQTFSGNFAVVTYGSTILGAAGVTLDAELLSISFPTIMMVGSTASIIIMERIGRRVILGSSFTVAVCTQVCLATVLLLQHLGFSAPAWVPLLAIVAQMFVYAFGVLPVPYIFMTEIFNIQIRGKLISIITAQSWVMTFIQLAVFAPLTNACGMYTTFYIFAAVNLFGAALVLVSMPETRGKSGEEIEQILNK